MQEKLLKNEISNMIDISLVYSNNAKDKIKKIEDYKTLKLMLYKN